MFSLRVFLPAGLTLVMLTVLLMLGNWQVERLAWKADLIQRIELRTQDRNGPAKRTLASAADIAKLEKLEDEYRKVTLRGRFGPKVGLWFTQIENKPDGLSRPDAVGYHVLSPFYLADGSAIMVDQGFVPLTLVDGLKANHGKLQSLEVILRWPDKRGRFDNADRPEANLFYVRDTQALGHHWGVALPAPIGEVAAFGQGWPRGGQTRMVINNNHLQYAVTWFGLAIVLVIISGLWHIRFYKSGGRFFRQSQNDATQNDKNGNN
ncbi:MAG: SURF1 family protein [Rhodobiaceae bacterium]|jgi:surfeit locus 1 family protein|nr:SURF1 family protein [Rhodobiaceae bacterium]